MRKKYGKNRLGPVLEAKVHKVFELLGFTVKKLGQGKGINPDGIAKADIKGRSFVIIYDTKVRRSKYKLRTEYRKVRDYIEKYRRALRESGYEDIYFMTISSDFREDKKTNERLAELRSNTAANNIIFLKAKYLIYLLGIKIKHPEIKLEDIKKIFGRDGIVKEEELENVIPSLPPI